MTSMFNISKFNGDISGWDTSSVEFMDAMFENSKFNGDISGWDTSSVHDMSGMFGKSVFNGDISAWDTSSVKFMDAMFENSKFNNQNGINTKKVTMELDFDNLEKALYIKKHGSFSEVNFFYVG